MKFILACIKKYYIFVSLIFCIFMAYTIFISYLVQHPPKDKDNFVISSLLSLGNFPVLLKSIGFNSNNITQIYNKNDIPIKTRENLQYGDNTRHKYNEQLLISPQYKNDALLILSRYNGELKQNIVEIIDLIDFSVIHRYTIDFFDLNKQIDFSKYDPSFRNYAIPVRLRSFDIEIDDDLNLYSVLGEYGGPLLKVDQCSKVINLNQDVRAHHSLQRGLDKTFLTLNNNYPINEFVANKLNLKKDTNFKDNGIVRFDEDLNILYSKSLLELLIKNKILPTSFYLQDSKTDPIHANDVEEAVNDTNHWKKGDLFISSRNLSAIIHLRPSDNKIINFIQGPHINQHDIDIISDHEISFFNNNSRIGHGINEFSEILIYDFEDNKFKSKFKNTVEKEKIYSYTGGGHHIFKNGSLLILEQNSARLVMFDKSEEKVLQFTNVYNEDIYPISWFDVIEDKDRIKHLKQLINFRKDC